MNTKIARQLIEATKPRYQADELKWYADDIVKTHNHAANYGFIDLPTLDFKSVEHEGDTITVSVKPKCGMADISDLFNLKQAWGADGIEILTGDDPAICIVFSTK